MRTTNRKSEKNNQTPNDPLMTQTKFDDLKNKLERLIKVSRPHWAAEVRRLAELGDFSENVEYQLAKGKLRGINNAITKIEQQLNQAVIIQPKAGSDTVEVGHTVTVEVNGKEKMYQILGSSETDPEKGIISYTSPIGAGLVGRRVGERFVMKIGGREVEYNILKIQ